MSQQILEKLRFGPMSALELRYSIGCTHEQIYAELLALETIGRVRVKTNWTHGVGTCYTEWRRII